MTRSDERCAYCLQPIVWDKLGWWRHKYKGTGHCEQARRRAGNAKIKPDKRIDQIKRWLSRQS